MGRCVESCDRPVVALSLLILLGAALRVPSLDLPLLEGAATKQTHTAMVARNLYRGRATWTRPVVDDIGRPGYFVKELPLLPLATAAIYRFAGGVDERYGRGLSALAWLAGTPLVYSLVRANGTPAGPSLAAFWYVAAPLGVAYSRAFMSEAMMVAASLAALCQALFWRRRPSGARAAVLGALVGLALLLKPHAAFWLAPALAVALLSRRTYPPGRGRDDDGTSGELPARPSALAPLGAIALGAAVAGGWYLHAAAIHLRFPVPGATVATGWIDPALLLRAETPAILARQYLCMVFTPLGVGLALLGWRHGTPWSRGERALLAWGAGVVVQCLVFATRLFDESARGTEYYNLAAVPAAAILIARGIESASAIPRWTPARVAIGVSLLAGLLLSSHGAAEDALAVPERYRHLLRDCAGIRAATQPDDELVVIADRGGTVLYYCDRHGTTFLPAAAHWRPGPASERATGSDVRRAFAGATHLLLPFPELVPRTAEFERWLSSEWRRVEAPVGDFELYARASGSGPTSRRTP